MKEQPKKKRGFWLFMKDLITIALPEIIERIKISKRK